MCAIFGSINPSTFEILYEANKERGNFASSAVRLVNNDQLILKKEGDIDFDKVDLRLEEPNTVDYYMGHVQAPTSAKRSWDWHTSHPFDSISWMVFHNGVLTNADELRYLSRPGFTNPVDTALVPELLQAFEDQCKKKNRRPVDYIKDVVQMLEGTFAVAIVDCERNDVYLARVGSILHYNNKGDYSTLPGKGYKELPEGVILKLNQRTKRFNKVGEFKTKSPFLFI
jgi:glucosamine 6-phosphate synthetase-like amidotransferase/phosphosugar isomerase protein